MEQDKTPILLIESEIVPVGEIALKDIKGDNIPKDAEYAALNPSEKFIEACYRFINVPINDGTVNRVLNYWSECGSGWMPSAYNDKNNRDYKKLKEKKFLKIIG